MKKKELRTTFSPEFIQLMKMEAIKRGIYVNELIEKAIKEYLNKEED